MTSGQKGRISTGFALGILGFAASLRLLRAATRWDEPFFDYTTYHLPFADPWHSGHFGQAALKFAGLHPPLYSFLLTLTSDLSSAPLAAILLSATLSTAAVYFTFRAARIAFGTEAALLAATWLAVEPIQLAYSAEVNNYPLLSCTIALLLWAGFSSSATEGNRTEANGMPSSASAPTWPAAPLPGQTGRRWLSSLALVLCGALAGWTHILGLLAAFLIVPMASRSIKQAIACVSGLLLLCAPVMANAYDISINSNSYRQPILSPIQQIALFRDRFEPTFAFTGFLALVGFLLAGWRVIRQVKSRSSNSRKWPGSAARKGSRPIHMAFNLTLFLLLLIGTFRFVGVAARHQFPYLISLGPPLAVCIGGLGLHFRDGGIRRSQQGSSALNARFRSALSQVSALTRHVIMRFSLLFTLLGIIGVFSVVSEARKLSSIEADLQKPRAVDAAIAQSNPGDAIWLITPYEPDDDKHLTSSVLWRFKPWEAMPASRELKIDPTDYRYGLPRAWRGRCIYLSTRVFPEPMERVLEHHLASGNTVYVVLYDWEREAPLEEALEIFLARRSRAAGPARSTRIFTTKITKDHEEKTQDLTEKIKSDPNNDPEARSLSTSAVAKELNQSSKDDKPAHKVRVNVPFASPLNAPAQAGPIRVSKRQFSRHSGVEDVLWQVEVER